MKNEESTGTFVVEDVDLTTDILIALRGAEELASDHEIYTTTTADYQDYYEIISEYDSAGQPDAQNEIYTTIVFEQNGIYYLYECYPSREEITYFQTSETFYQSLTELFK